MKKSPGTLILSLVCTFAMTTLGSCFWDDNESHHGDFVPGTPSVPAVTFHANGGSGLMEPQVIEPGSFAPLQANAFTRANHKFAGWAYDPVRRVEFLDRANFVMNTSSVELYALWEYTGTTIETLSHQSSTTVSMKSVAGVDGDGFLLAHDGSSYTQATSVSAGFQHKIHPFDLSAYEVTYELWYLVRTWAQAHGYSFSVAGREGSEGLAGDAPSDRGRLKPVTDINWRDALIWCNAYNEMTGRTIVYYADSGFTTPIKTSTGAQLVNDSPGSVDNPFIRADANGYRFPTEGEWQYAASCAGKYPYDYASGADAKYDATAVVDHDGDGKIRSSYDVAWYYDNSAFYSNQHPDYGTHAVGTKAANAFGMFDMSGNVWEMCYDWNGTNFPIDAQDYSGVATGTYRIIRGGSWLTYANFLQTGYRGSCYPNCGHTGIGFRLARSRSN